MMTMNGGGAVGGSAAAPAARSALEEGDDTVDDSVAAPQAAQRWLRVHHETSYHYDAGVEGAHHLAHLRPRDTAWQQVRGWTLQVSPAPDVGIDLASGIRETIDPWGNARQAFAHSQVHDALRVVSAFDVGLGPSTLPLAGRGQPWREVADGLRYRAGRTLRDGEAFEAVEFALGSPLAPVDDALAAWAQPAARAAADIEGLALALMHQLHEEFSYQPQATNVATGALEALALREGVCQDFAHVMIGALRSLGLAARYVSGYLLTQPPPGRARLVGADASHAWVAVWCPPQGWIAFDPTNDIAAGRDHVTLAWGRDYEDVAPLRGVIRGGGRTVPDVAVTVMPLDEAEPGGEASAPGAAPA